MLFRLLSGKWLIIACCVLCYSSAHSQTIDSTAPKPKPLGAVLRTVREVHFINDLNDTIPEIFQIETTKAKKIRDIKVHFAIYKQGRILYSYSWKANDFFDPKDHLSDTIKWLRLGRIMRVFFSDQNFSLSDSEKLSSLFSRVQSVDIVPGTDEAKEYEASSHNIFAVYAGRETLYGVTWLASKKKFVTLWRN
jgi:hypothetical protein